ncbi:MAG: aldo/keto reductase [Pseudomonadota bacterium]
MITAFGPQGLPPSPLAFGTMQFGGTADDGASAEMYAACRAAGITHFDTAWVYTHGASETITGRLIAPERDKIVLATKINYQGSGARDVMLGQWEDSKRRLNLDHVDILYLHRWNDESPLIEQLATMAEIHAQGGFSHMGVSNWAAWQVMKGQAICAAEGFPPIEVLQPMYNLVKRQAEVELLPMCLSEGIAVFGYSPLGGGLLTGKYASGAEGRLASDTRYKARYGQDWMHKAAQGLSALAAEAGVPAATLAVRWAMAHPGHTAPLISARSAAQLAPSLDALSAEISDEIMDRVTALSPTPPPATDRLEEQG